MTFAVMVGISGQARAGYLGAGTSLQRVTDWSGEPIVPTPGGAGESSYSSLGGPLWGDSIPWPGLPNPSLTFPGIPLLGVPLLPGSNTSGTTLPGGTGNGGGLMVAWLPVPPCAGIQLSIRLVLADGPALPPPLAVDFFHPPRPSSHQVG